MRIHACMPHIWHIIERVRAVPVGEGVRRKRNFSLPRSPHPTLRAKPGYRSRSLWWDRTAPAGSYLDGDTHQVLLCVPMKEWMRSGKHSERERYPEFIPDFTVALCTVHVARVKCRPEAWTQARSARVAVDGAIDSGRWHPLGDLLPAPRHPARARPMMAAHCRVSLCKMRSCTRVCKDV